MPSANVNVSGTNHLATPWVNVSGTWHKAQSVWANIAGTWHQVFAGASAFSITAGTDGFNIGYASGFGSITGASLDGTHSIITLEDNAAPITTLIVNGFASDPGSTWLTSMTINGITRTGASATYSHGSGTAQWTWGSTLSLVNGTAYPGSIIHL